MAPQQHHAPQLIPYQTLRQAIGWLGILLPAMLLLGNKTLAQCSAVQSSISHYYYTSTGHWFTGILSAVAMFLFSYKGYDKKDNIAASIAAFAAILIALFPTNMVTQVPEKIEGRCLLFTLPENTLRNAVHYISAALFFCTLAYISIFLFTKSGNIITWQKKQRNRIFRTCGWVMLLCIGLISIYGIWGSRWPGLKAHHPVFWLEWLALAAFGISWLVKGQLVLKDEA